MAEYSLPDSIMAMTEDNGTVVTLLKRDPEMGMVYRHDGKWNPVVNPTVFNDLSFVGVTDSAEAIYDKYEKDDKLVTLAHYIPTDEGPKWSDNPVVLYYEPEHEQDGITLAEDPETSLTASALIHGPDDIEAAIAAAALNPDLRWYVERRVVALGIEANLPWQRN